MNVKTNRIPAIDGLRTLAVLGVLWTHVWMLFNVIPMKVANIDINRGLSFGRNGVDLFFVISGFCMYLMYASKIEHFNADNFLGFLKKRWVRIAPAFYAVVLVESCLYFIMNGIFPAKDLLYHFFFLNIFLHKSVLSTSFWSLATEWHFYLLFPFLFFRLGTKEALTKRLIFMMVICIIFRLVFFYMHRANIVARQTIDSPEIWYRFIEFGFGIFSARIFLRNKPLPGWISGSAGFIIGFAIAYIGRIFMVTEFVNKTGGLAFVFRTFAEPVMTFGFAWMLLSLIATKGIFSVLLSSRPFLYLGKISYSIYLWHSMIVGLISFWIIDHLGVSLLTFHLALLISVIVVIPVSALSFKLLEAPYFKKNKKAREMAYVEVI